MNSDYTKILTGSKRANTKSRVHRPAFFFASRKAAIAIRGGFALGRQSSLSRIPCGPRADTRRLVFAVISSPLLPRPAFLLAVVVTNDGGIHDVTFKQFDIPRRELGP